jgi:hypothetical protein
MVKYPWVLVAPDSSAQIISAQMESSSMNVNLLDKDQFREDVVRSAGKGHDDISYQGEDFADNNAEWRKCAFLCFWEFC